MSYKAKVSIIVPIYNVEKYLKKCLDSLIGQTLTEIEIICVNDGSTDNSLSILNEYKNKDSRILVVSQDNSGLSCARNTGIKHSNGEYILFVDSDDWIDLDTCEVAYKTAINHKAEVVMCSYTREFDDYSKPKSILREDVIIFDELDVKNRLQRRFVGLLDEELEKPENMESLSTAWGKLILGNLIHENKIEFIDTKIIGTEDAFFNLCLFQHVKCAVYINKHFFHYRKTNSTSLTATYKKELYSRWNRLYEYMEIFIKENNLGLEYTVALRNRIALSIIYLGLNVLSSDMSKFEQIKEIKRIISSAKFKLAYRHLALKHFPLHWKLFFLTAKLECATGLHIFLIVIKKVIS